MKPRGGARKGAGRPKKDSPLGYLRVLDDPQASEPEKSRAAQGLADCRWNRTERQRFLRATSADYPALRVQTVDKLWAALLVGLPNMAERGNVGQAWFAYRMITRKRYGAIRSRAEVGAKLRALAPQGARALWRISVVNDPKGLYKSTALLKLRRQARTALCKGIGIRITRQLIRVQGTGFAKLLLTTIAKARPTLSPEQAVVLAAWAGREQGIRFLAKGVEVGMFKLVRQKGLSLNLPVTAAHGVNIRGRRK